MDILNKTGKFILFSLAVMPSIAMSGAVDTTNITTFVPNSAAVASEVNGNFTEQTTQINDNAARIATLEGTTLNTSTGTLLADCKAIAASAQNRGDGIYWMDPDGGDTANAFRGYCDMTTFDGGWTQVMNIEPADGNIVSFTNTRFWQDNAVWGQLENHFTHDYKSPAAWLVSGTNIMVQVANPGPVGHIIGWKAWDMSTKSLDTFFDSADNTVQTTSVIGVSVDAVYTYEALIKNGEQLVSNRNINANADRVRLGVDVYPLQGDDNQPGLGTQMNEASCGVGVNCYRFKDVELWVNSGSNLWATPPLAEGTFKWIGTDGGCGTSCGTNDHVAGPGYSPYWTYRIYVR